MNYEIKRAATVDKKVTKLEIGLGPSHLSIAGLDSAWGGTRPNATMSDITITVTDPTKSTDKFGQVFIR